MWEGWGGGVFEVGGRCETIERGRCFERAGETGARQSVPLGPDERGHYIVDGMINGGYMRFIVDTGATTISLAAADATRLGIDYRSSRRGPSPAVARSATCALPLTPDTPAHT